LEGWEADFSSFGEEEGGGEFGEGGVEEQVRCDIHIYAYMYK